MRSFLPPLILLFLSVNSTAKPIDKITAQKVGFTFLRNQISTTDVNLTSLQLTYQLTGKQISQSEVATENTYLYIFNYSKGFVIVSGDDCAKPILGYSSENRFDTLDIPTNMKKWLEIYKNEIRYAIEKKLSDPETLAEWNRLLFATSQQHRGSGTQSVAPLVQTHWNQSPYYNDLAPFDNQYNERTVTGCVATAMAQIMKYWNYPTVGTGFHSYNHPKYGNLSANFGATTYQWASMPNVVSSTNTAVATLMYHCGVSVDMNYSTTSSNAWMISAQSPIQHCSEYALKTYFGYRNTLAGIQKANYTTSQWIALLKTEFDANRPVLYAGFGQGGHCFVADGYDNNDFIHFNWGWGGYGPDGYFSVTAINPPALGTGGGNGGGYTSGQQAVIGIQPPATNPAYSLRLYNTVTPSSSTINYTQAFSITTNIANVGTGTFNGDYCAAIFDNANTFVGYVEIKTAQSLQNGYAYTNNLVFSNSGMAAMMPGTYTVGIYSRPTGGTQWTLVSNYSPYTNFPSIQVVYNNDIALNSTITTTPSTLIKSQPVSINLNIKNVGSSTFTGKYYTALYNLDGTFAQFLDSVNEVTGLPPNYTYSSPYLSFNNSNIAVNAGSYLIATLHKPNSGSLQLTGANSFQNPRKVIVKNPDLTPDIYEVNDNISQSFSLPVSFSGNTVNLYTTGSNCHVGNDYDFYKIILPTGYNYTLKPRLQDSYNSNNGKSYTLDAVFAYSFDGINWSEAYDDTLINNINMNNGGTIYFAVAPYFSGSIGTYLLETPITRSSILPVTFVNFNATLKEKIVQLDWSTSTEINSDYFVVERSFDGKNFNTIGKVKASTNSSTLREYNLVDSAPAMGKNYYRIKQVDLDGKYSLTDIKFVTVTNSPLLYSITPNPAKTFVTLNFERPQRRYKIVVTDLQGKTMFTTNPSSIFVTQQRIDVSGIPNGVYLISIMTEENNSTQKLLIHR